MFFLLRSNGKVYLRFPPVCFQFVCSALAFSIFSLSVWAGCLHRRFIHTEYKTKINIVLGFLVKDVKPIMSL